MVEEQTTNIEPVSAGSIVLNEETYQSILNMLKSGDPENHAVAQQLLGKVDVQKSIYWIWKMAQYNSSRMVNLRTKMGRKFRDESNLFVIVHKSSTAFLRHIETKGWLTEEIFKALEEDLVNQIRHDIKSLRGKHFFDVYVKIKPEFESLANNNNLIYI